MDVTVKMFLTFLKTKFCKLIQIKNMKNLKTESVKNKKNILNFILNINLIFILLSLKKVDLLL